MVRCICVLCVVDDCVCSPPDDKLPRVSCEGCHPSYSQPEDKLKELLEEADKDYEEDNSWRKWDCYTCKDTGECPHCIDDYDEL